MRIAVAVVVGCVLVGFGHVARAEDAPRKRSEVCLDGCNLGFERCQAKEGVKPTGRCHIEVVKCKNDCPFELPADPNAPPTTMSHARCVDDCRETYKKCLGRAENKRGGKCQADDVRCEKACPKPPEEVAAPATTGEGGAPGTGAPVAAPVPPPAKRKMRIEGAAAPAPLPATPVPAPAPPPVVQRQPAPVPTVRSGDAAPPASAAPVAASAPVGASAEAARPQPAEERGFFGNLKCFFVSCEQPGSSACLKGCGVQYDECRALESKRGGECNTRLMNCRKDCSDAAALKR